jgi:hypothetical protein
MNIRSISDADRSIWPGCSKHTLNAPAGMEDEVVPAEVLSSAR